MVELEILTSDIRMTSREPDLLHTLKVPYLGLPEIRRFRGESPGFARNVVSPSGRSVALLLGKPPDSHLPPCQPWPRWLDIGVLRAGLEERCVYAAGVFWILLGRLFVGTLTMEHIWLESSSALK